MIILCYAHAYDGLANETVDGLGKPKSHFRTIPNLFNTPDAPTNLIATGINTGGMIQFTAPTSDGGSPITNYEYSIDNGSTWITPSPAIITSPLIISSGLTSNPTIADSKTVDGTGVGSFTSAITGLASGTTYYVRSYATNSVGTIYGTEVSFTTL